MKILIVKVSALGDIVHALPVLAWIRSAVPAARIDWLVEESFASLLEGHPLVHRVVRLRTKAWRNGNIIAALQGAFGPCAGNGTIAFWICRETVKADFSPCLPVRRYDLALTGAAFANGPTCWPPTVTSD